MVSTLRNGVPTFAVDPVSGGDKVTRQADKPGWTEAFKPELVSDENLSTTVTRCLSEAGGAKSALVKEPAILFLKDFGVEFTVALQVSPGPKLRVALIPKVGKVLE
ncbi:hypothetical protein PANO111632_12320 [Paracoccus nototheniae]|uniref:Uncharacterized protein n=1 Tax=Paracoccus nototheniae TaxID=2489002 RepID=A0ABW4DYG0_9RHOB|nr:hypothetical protein [Paracoccus nototheniae]